MPNEEHIMEDRLKTFRLGNFFSPEFLTCLYFRYSVFINYSVIGITGVLIDLNVFFFLYNNFDIHYLLINLVSVSSGIINNFVLNARFNFKVNDKLFLRFITFYSVGIFGIGISSFLLYVSIELLSFPIFLMKVITIFIVVAIQFFLNKTFSFKSY